MPTWLTGLFVTARIARSASEPPRNSHRSPVAAPAIASSSESAAAAVAGTRVTYASMRVPWKLLGLAGVAGVAATGVIVARRRRTQQDYDPAELRERLHGRLAEVAPEAATAQAPETAPPGDAP
jgi:hypothetical protein